MTPKPLSFFIERIGKRIYRDNPKDNCQCATCRGVEAEGIVIRNEAHAEYLAMIDADFSAEGVDLNYRDEK